jgi:plastocyanin
MKRSAAVLLVLAATGVPAAPAAAGGGCWVGGPGAEVVTTTVHTKHACWVPQVAVVATGATVTFRNEPGGLPHNVGGPAIRHEELPAGATRTVTFAEPGLYPFACTIHPGMSGVVLVRDGAAGVPPADTAAQPAAVPPADTANGGGSALPWVAGASGLALIVGLGAFARRARGVPLPAR